MIYAPRLDSVRQHHVPHWYHDSKFGIFIHWGLYSVPGFAYADKGSQKEVTRKLIEAGGFGNFLRNNLVSEWYQNTLRLGGSSTVRYHKEQFGEGFSYEDFAGPFNQASQKWDLEAWAALFKAAGARYAILVTKHHDGFLLWPSTVPNPNKPGYGAARDIVGDLARVLTLYDLRLGLYYSSALDWTFSPRPIASITDVMTSGPDDRVYAQYVEDHWFELIERYHPAILWSDIGYPRLASLPKLFAHYYNCVPDGVVNDRWMQYPLIVKALLGVPPFKAILNRVGERQLLKDAANFLPTPAHFDFRTPEYSHFTETTPYKWETDRGIGNSFAYNQADFDENHLTPDDAIRLLVDIVSKNGNLLLSVGPRADGSIPEIQERCLRGMGIWLHTNGEAVFGTRPWIRSAGLSREGLELRFTQTEKSLYVILMARPDMPAVTLQNLRSNVPLEAVLLNTNQALDVKTSGDGVQITWPESLETAPAYAVRFSPKPEFVGT